MILCCEQIYRIASIALLGVCSLVLMGCVGTTESTSAMPGGDPVRGALVLRDYGCHSCHVIPGVRGANALVGPPLTAWSQRHYIAGTLSNTPENLIHWLQYPQRVEPGTAMPDLAVTEQDARDMGAYLYTLTGNEGPWSIGNWVNSNNR